MRNARVMNSVKIGLIAGIVSLVLISIFLFIVAVVVCSKVKRKQSIPPASSSIPASRAPTVRSSANTIIFPSDCDDVDQGLQEEINCRKEEELVDMLKIPKIRLGMIKVMVACAAGGRENSILDPNTLREEKDALVQHRSDGTLDLSNIGKSKLNCANCLVPEGFSLISTPNGRIKIVEELHGTPVGEAGSCGSNVQVTGSVGPRLGIKPQKRNIALCSLSAAINEIGFWSKCHLHIKKINVHPGKVCDFFFETIEIAHDVMVKAGENGLSGARTPKEAEKLVDDVLEKDPGLRQRIGVPDPVSDVNNPEPDAPLAPPSASAVPLVRAPAKKLQVSPEMLHKERREKFLKYIRGHGIRLGMVKVIVALSVGRDEEAFFDQDASKKDSVMSSDFKSSPDKNGYCDAYGSITLSLGAISTSKGREDIMKRLSDRRGASDSDILIYPFTKRRNDKPGNLRLMYKIIFFCVINLAISEAKTVLRVQCVKDCYIWNKEDLVAFVDEMAEVMPDVLKEIGRDRLRGVRPFKESNSLEEAEKLVDDVLEKDPGLRRKIGVPDPVSDVNNPEPDALLSSPVNEI